MARHGGGTSLASDARAAARGGLASLVLQTMGRVLGFVFVVVVTRRLGPSEFGRYSTVTAIVLFANLLGDFGSTPAITRLVSRDPDRADPLLAGTALASLTVGWIVYGCIAAFALLAAYGHDQRVDILIGGLAIPVQAVLWSFVGALDGRGLILRRAVLTLLQTVVVASGGVFVLFGAGVRAPIFAIAASPLVTLVAAAITARVSGVWRSPLRLDRAEVRALIAVALPFGVLGLLQAVNLRFDVILLSLARSTSETATYDVAQRLVEACGYVALAVCGPALYILSARIGGRDDEGAGRAYTTACRILYLLGLPLSLGVVLFARPIAVAMLGASFAGAERPLAIMGASLWLMFLVSLQSVLVQAGDHVRRGVAVVGFTAAATVVLDLVLIPKWGATGAATAMFVSWLCSAVALARLHRRTVGIRTPLPSAGVLVALLVAGGVAVTLRDVPLVAAAGAGAAYLVTVVLTKAVTPQDIEKLRETVGRRRGSAPIGNDPHAVTA